MPTHRRNASKLIPSKCHTFNDDGDNGGCHGMIPRHISLTFLEKENPVAYEAHLLLLFIICLCAQYLNLYRTVFDFSKLNLNIPINFHLIDFNSVILSLVLVAIPLMQHICNSVASLMSSSFRDYFFYPSSLLILSFCSVICARCAYFIYLSQGLNGLLCISYSSFMYLLIYFPNLMQAYESSKQASFQENAGKFLKAIAMPKRFSDEQPIHTCYSNPSLVREEILSLKNLFNERLKFILFKSVLIAYYSTFLPICFAGPRHAYDTNLTGQFCALTWISAFLLLTSHLYSPHFYDVLHKSSLHLGKWQKLETRNSLLPCTSWAENASYPQGVVIKYSREYFKAEGITNCAEPTNQAHLRYYIVFSNPVGGFGTLLGLLMVLVFVQLFLLIRSSEWYKLISLTMLIVINSWTVFRLIRTYHVLKEVYKVESQLQDDGRSSLD
ncbi:transmembrane protein 39A [Brevipalpus obovatus]|uniref:transmembrane protein 39A n=1 Tax=Brevipalpus obovatus TaxID=246614 RepID=UPI003D9F0BE0